QYSICNGTVCKQVMDVVGFADPWGAGPLMYGGGPIQKYPKVYLVYVGWVSDPSGEQPYLEAFFNGLGGSSWANIDTQYDDSTRGNVTNPTGQLAGIWSDPTSVPATVTGGDTAAAAVRAVAHFGYDQDANYFIATPTGHSTA